MRWEVEVDDRYWEADVCARTQRDVGVGNRVELDTELDGSLGNSDDIESEDVLKSLSRRSLGCKAGCCL